MTRHRWPAGLLAAALALPLLSACGSSSGAHAKDGTEPTAGTWKTWVIGSPAKLAVPAPPKKGSPEAAADQAELKDLAGKRTTDIRTLVQKYSGPLPTKPWTDTALDLVSKSAKDPPLSSRNYALLHVAMDDAVTAAYYWKYRYKVDPPGPDANTMVDPGPDPSYPSANAAIAGAASRVLAYLYPNLASQARMDGMADQAADARVYAGVNTRHDVDAGLDLGHKVADLVIARAKTDGSDKKWDGTRPPGIGRGPAFWEPPPGADPSSPPTEPLAGTWKTWVMTSGSQFRAPPPPKYGSPEYVAQATQVSEGKEHLTPEQKQAVDHYAGVAGTPLPAGIVADTSQGDILKAVNGDLVDGEKLTLPRAVRAMALVTVALADAGVASWDTKYTYWMPRPENAIHDLGINKDFKPVIDTPRFPAYVSGSSTYAGAVQQVMTYLFPSHAAEFKQRAETQARSRIWAGIHYPMDEAGLTMGRKVGDLVVARAKADGADS
ncbi:MAG TPA: hypothetical protein VFJ61_04595 [Solirubrobacterales bacterium]|nr:hypothetical protein [Solirubrobacterales bacterium]